MAENKRRRRINKKRVRLACGRCAAVLLAAVLALAKSAKKQVGLDRQFAWDSAVFDGKKTTATLMQHSPQPQNTVLEFTSPWEAGGVTGFNTVQLQGGWAMYYAALGTDGTSICMASSADGITWTKPRLGMCTYDGSTQNNIIIDAATGLAGGMYACADTGAKRDEKYKAIGVKADGSLITLVSADGISWQTKGTRGKNKMDITGADLGSLYHDGSQYVFAFVKDGKLMQTTSKNFTKWSKARAVKQASKQAASYRTANITPYYRGNGTLVGFPLRQTQVSDDVINTNFAGTALARNNLPQDFTNLITDTTLLFSSGEKLASGDGAWLTAGPQYSGNWLYGDAFVAGGLVQTADVHSAEGGDDVLSVYVAENLMTQGTTLRRYISRTDGFASYHSGYNTTKVVTQPFKVQGSRMTINFATSTDGYVFVRLVGKNGKPLGYETYTDQSGQSYKVAQYTSYQMFGDRVDREVAFNTDLSKLQGKTVVAEFYLSDADLYSFKFDNEEYINNAEWQPVEIPVREGFGTYSYAAEDTPLDIGTERQLFWDDYIVDAENTDALLAMHSPQRREALFDTDLPWEGDNCDFYVIVNDEENGQPLYRMYYLGWDYSDATDINVCYAYSYDGVSWVKPSLGIVSYTDSDGTVYNNTNIILKHEETPFDNFFVYRDTRDDVPQGQRYKAIAEGGYDQLGYPSFGLWAWTSADGIHWKKTHRVLPQQDDWFAGFDSVNTLVWDEKSQQFFTYFRVRNEQETGDITRTEFRKIYGATSGWFVPVNEDTMFPLEYGENAPLTELYTNNIAKYYRAPQLFLGFPTRFTGRYRWEKNYEYLANPQERWNRVEAGQPTRNLSMTDCLFMTSRDGYNWSRQNEAWLTAGPEYNANWIYGNCYPAHGLVETRPLVAGQDNQLSTYVFEGKFFPVPTTLYRYTFRMDGLMSYTAGTQARTVTTKPLVFAGSSLYINFCTSAAGSVTVTVLDGEGQPVQGLTATLMGDNTDRKVVFDGDLSQLAGQPVQLQFTLADAEIYSFVFR